MIDRQRISLLQILFLLLIPRLILLVPQNASVNLLIASVLAIFKKNQFSNIERKKKRRNCDSFNICEVIV